LRAADASTQIANQRRRPINLVDLKERIAIGGYIRRRERHFILECINAHAPSDDAAGGFEPPPF
jgi:hypothetical protein